jgi:hypothetical protein
MNVMILQKIAQQDSAAALDCIRNKMQPLGVYGDVLHTLAGCLLCDSSIDLQSIANYEGPTLKGRQVVLSELQVRLWEFYFELAHMSFTRTNESAYDCAHEQHL